MSPQTVWFILVPSFPALKLCTPSQRSLSAQGKDGVALPWQLSQHARLIPRDSQVTARPRMKLAVWKV